MAMSNEAHGVIYDALNDAMAKAMSNAECATMTPTEFFNAALSIVTYKAMACGEDTSRMLLALLMLSQTPVNVARTAIGRAQVIAATTPSAP